VWVLPRITAPARRSAATISASAVAGALFRRDLLFATVVMPATSMMSLMPIGMPCNGPRKRPALASWSSRSASARALSWAT
jgi:hypothetical protein